VANARVTDARTDITWSGGAPVATPAVTMLAAAADRATADAALGAAGVIAVPVGERGAAPRVTTAPGASGGDSVAAGVVVLPGYERRDALLRDARPVGAPWQGDLIARVAADPVFAAAGDALPRAAVVQVNGRARLAFFASSGADAPATVALVAAVRRAWVDGASPAESEPDALSAAALAALQSYADARAGQATAPTGDGATAPAAVAPPDSPFGARWLWAITLAALGGEAVARRAMQSRRTRSMATHAG
ncbi:MAG TPA: hypothetical protein VG916_13235, partial [Gemmatimonadaceae bacterium]|nr:hypothetical protein [Gemmatimonadaceae bacterium]